MLPKRNKDKDGNYYYKDFDIQCKVDRIGKIDDETQKIMLQDLSGQRFEAKIELQKYPWVLNKG